MPPATAATTMVSLRELADLAIGTPEVGAVNFTALHTLIVAMLRSLNLQEVRIDFQSPLPSPEPSRTLEPPQAVLSDPQLAVSKGKPRGSLAKPPTLAAALESQVKGLGGQVQDLSRQLQTVTSQVQGIVSHVQHLTAPIGELDARDWLEEEPAKLTPARARAGSLKIAKDEQATVSQVSQAMELLHEVVEDVKTLKEAQEKAQELPESSLAKALQRIDVLEKIVRERDEFLDLVSRKMSLMPVGEEVTMVTWEELEQAITDGWKASQGSSETTTGLPKRKGRTSVTSNDILQGGVPIKRSSADPALDFPSGYGSDQTLSGVSGIGKPSEGVTRERSRGVSATTVPGREQHPRARDEGGLAKSHHPSMSQFRVESDRRRTRELPPHSLAHLRKDEREAHPGPVQQDLPAATVARDQHHQVSPDQHRGVYPSQGQIYPRPVQHGLRPLGTDPLAWHHPSTYPHGVVPLSMGQFGMMPPGMDEQGLVPPGMDQYGMVPPLVPGTEQQGVELPSTAQPGMVPRSTYQYGMVLPGIDQQPGVDQHGLVPFSIDQHGFLISGMDQQGLVLPGMDPHGLVPHLTDQHGLVSPGLMQVAADQQGFIQPSLETSGFIQPSTEEHDIIQPGADQRSLVPTGTDQAALAQPGAGQPGLVQPGMDHRGLGQRVVAQPGLVQPGAGQRGLAQPRMDQRGLVQPGAGQPGLFQPGIGQPAFVQPGADQRGLGQVDQRGLIQAGTDPHGFFQPGAYPPGLVQPGAYPPGLVQPGAYPRGLVQPGAHPQGLVQSSAYPRGSVPPGAYPRGLVQPGTYPEGFLQPSTDQRGLVQPGIDQRGLRQPGTERRGLIPPGTELRGLPTFHPEFPRFFSHPYQHGVIPPGRYQHDQVSPLLANQGLASPGIGQEGLSETYQQGLLHRGTDQHGLTPLSTRVGSVQRDGQHLVSPGPDQQGQVQAGTDQRDRAYSIPESRDLLYPGPHGPGVLGVDPYVQTGLDPKQIYASDQPGISVWTTPSQAATFARSTDSLNYLYRVSSEKSDFQSERQDSLDKLAPSFPMAVETFRLMGELIGLYVELKENMKELDEEQEGQTDLEKIQHLLGLMVKKSIPADLQEQLKTLKSLTKEIWQEKAKMDRIQRILEGTGEQEIGKEMKNGQLSLQLGILRVTVADIEKELAELRESQERGKVSMEHSVSEASLYLQDQLDKLRTVIESMLTSSSTLLSMSMAPHKTLSTLKPGQIDPEATCPACSLDLSHQVSTLVQRYEQLQDMVNNLAASRPSKKAKLQSQDEELLGHVQSAILQVQGDCEKLNITTSNLIEDHRQKQKDIDVLYQGLEKLEKEKANREHLEMEIDVKADKSALAAKVSRVQFDATTEQLNHMMQELVAKMSGQGQDWQKMLDKLLVEMDSKLDRLELDPVKQLLEDRWKSLRQQLKERSPLYQADEAAAMRRQLLAHFHCLSCDRPLETAVTGQFIPVTPVGPALPGHRSLRPYTISELEQVRRQSRNLKLGSTAFPRGELAHIERSVGRLRTMHSKMLMDIEKVQIHFGGSVKASSQMIRELLQAQCLSSPCYKRVPDTADYTYSSVPRRCGGSHTLTYPYRRTRLQHLSPGLCPPEEVQIAMKHDEVDILGLDGHIYKGRMDTRLPGILTKDTSVSGMAKHKAKQSRPHVHRQQSLSDNGQLPSRPQSAQMLAGNSPDSLRAGMAFSTVLMKYSIRAVLMDTPIIISVTKPALREALRDYNPWAPGWLSWKSMRLLIHEPFQAESRLKGQERPFYLSFATR
uniref:glutamine-rich protein 2 n=1 Tax=Halichoerus grypus TaxID=9711 RepID=UPI0016597000|nr:glutamine-rich protein 2 [Halichoerus grypus]